MESGKVDEYNSDTDLIKCLNIKINNRLSTWHIGELQDDWDFIYEKYKRLILVG